MEKTTRLLATIAFLASAAFSPGAPKPFPKGLMDLPGSISAQNPIGLITDHPWESPSISGLRIRTGWDNSETADGTYNWVQIDECLALALTTGKFIGLGVTAGINSPPWLLGGQTFLDGSTVEGVATLTSLTANFTSADVGRIIVSAYFPVGTTITAKTSSTVVQTSAAATKSTTIKKPLTFSVLSRVAGGVPFRVLSSDEGVMPVPWDPIYKSQWKTFVAAMGAKYDNNPQLRYVVMTGFQKVAECYLATTPEDIAFFDASALAAGYLPTDTLPAGLVAWEATAKEMIGQFMASFPNTPLLITGARPYGSPDYQEVGTEAMNDIFDWGLSTYPGRFGIMNCQLHVGSAAGYFLNSRIVDNSGTIPTGLQFLCAGTSNNPDNLPRLCDAPPWGDLPLLTIPDAVNTTCAAGVGFGSGYIEVYESDVNNPDLQGILAAHQAALLGGDSSAPQPPTNVHIVD